MRCPQRVAGRREGGLFGRFYSHEAAGSAILTGMMSQVSVKPVYVLYGDDEFLRDAHRREVVSLAVGEADWQTCLTVFDASAGLAEVLDELRTLPFLAPRRVVLIRDADSFVSAHRGVIEDYLQSPPRTATLILIVSSWPRSTRLYKLVEKIGRTFSCVSPERGVRKWMANVAGKRGRKISPEAVELMIEWLGNDLAILSGELEKLSLYVGCRETITADDVSTMVTATAGAGAFALKDAVIAGNVGGALAALDGMLVARGDEFLVLGLLAGHLRRALKGQQLAAAGKNPLDALNPRTPHSAKNAFGAMLSRRPLTAIEADFRRLIRADLGMKSGLKPAAALQELVVHLCR